MKKEEAKPLTSEEKSLSQAAYSDSDAVSFLCDNRRKRSKTELRCSIDLFFILSGQDFPHYH